MSNEQSAGVDTRIIKTKYKNHELLARFWNGRYRGRIWKNKVKIADYAGESIDLILDTLVQIVDQFRAKTFLARDRQTLLFCDYVSAWEGVLPSLDKQIVSALTLHARAKDNSIAVDRLARVCGCETFHGLLQYYRATEQTLLDELLLDHYTKTPKVNGFYIQPPYSVDEPSRRQTLILDKTWADSLLQANQVRRGQSA